jgi:hypothetical protein
MTDKPTLNSVQFGCGWGSPVPEGWIHYDASPTLRFERIKILGYFYTKNAKRFPNNVKYGDIVKGLPLPNGSVKRLYASHVIEHLSYDDAIKSIAHCFALLAPGGIFRLIVPDLQARAIRYVDKAAKNDPAASAQFLDTTMLGQRSRPRGMVALLQRALGGGEHLWMWDQAAMTATLAAAGFSDIRRCNFNDSDDPAFAELEEPGRYVDGDIFELALECRKLR